MRSRTALCLLRGQREKKFPSLTEIPSVGKSLIPVLRRSPRDPHFEDGKQKEICGWENVGSGDSETLTVLETLTMLEMLTVLKTHPVLETLTLLEKLTMLEMLTVLETLTGLKKLTMLETLTLLEKLTMLEMLTVLETLTGLKKLTMLETLTLLETLTCALHIFFFVPSLSLCQGFSETLHSRLAHWKISICSGSAPRFLAYL
ncbi:hypothetical protein Baya_16191 [Bagarius yarrelli]|uniref:Uncharacterized protein n=1 Tax=Bagarius yarrelli TaxID=175774 RepID=A0A556VUL0_BAGYA|nr:hypothetical protein Baya_16191 [Bagarius yarrelli]